MAQAPWLSAQSQNLSGITWNLLRPSSLLPSLPPSLPPLSPPHKFINQNVILIIREGGRPVSLLGVLRPASTPQLKLIPLLAYMSQLFSYIAVSFKEVLRLLLTSKVRVLFKLL